MLNSTFTTVVSLLIFVCVAAMVTMQIMECLTFSVF